jgi:sterol desaturase/sphingolipid hydroxylase (fatty acid hydroxylase superfamily)
VVVVCPMLALCWQVGEAIPFERLTMGVYIGIAALLILCEHFFAFRNEWGSAIRGTKTDFVYVIVATLIEKGSFIVCVTAVASLGRGIASALDVDFWPSHSSFGLQVVLALLIADVGAYFRHRLSHMSSILWRFHQIHHSVTGLYWIRSAYTHPVEQLLIMIAIMLPIAFLGAGDQVIAVVAFLFALSGLLQHANVDSRSSILNYIFATPEVHRIHHRADEIGNRSNYSAFFVLMDHLFGSYIWPARSEDPAHVGLEGVVAFPGDFLTHLTLPFRPDPTGLYQNDAWAGEPHVDSGQRTRIDARIQQEEES